MKKMRRLIPAIAMLLVSAVMLSTASFAWFSMSSEAKAEGMTVKATADSSLLIVDVRPTETGVYIPTAPSAGDFKAANGLLPLTPGQNDSITTLSPAIIDENGALTTLDTASIAKVDPSTGAAPDDAVFVAAGEGTNFYDYDVAIGAVGEGVTGTLTATISATTAKEMHKATSIAFYYSVCTDGELETETHYVDTVVFEDLVEGKAEQAIVDVENLLTIDEEQLGDYVIVTMRVFFDGEAADDNGSIYAKNTNMTKDSIKFDVVFTVAE